MRKLSSLEKVVIMELEVVVKEKFRLAYNVNDVLENSIYIVYKLYGCITIQLNF